MAEAAFTSKLTEEEVLAEFKKLDTNNDGNISLQEFQHAFQTLLGQSLTYQELRDLIAVFDDNQDGEIQFEEFRKMIESFANNPMTQVVMKSLFDQIDQNKSGKLERDEFEKFMKDAGDGVSPKVIAEMFAMGNKSQTDAMTWEEFQMVMTKTPSVQPAS